jgi:hypothetical protein
MRYPEGTRSRTGDGAPNRGRTKARLITTASTPQLARNTLIERVPGTATADVCATSATVTTGTTQLCGTVRGATYPEHPLATAADWSEELPLTLTPAGDGRFRAGDDGRALRTSCSYSEYRPSCLPS